jgi:hypothetical protein
MVSSVTQMVGVVLAERPGVAPGCEASLSYKKIELSVSNEYMYLTRGETGELLLQLAATNVLGNRLVPDRHSRAEDKGVPHQPRHSARFLRWHFTQED